MKTITTDKPNICFVGDIHGDFNGISAMMSFSGLTDVAYVFVGDCGFGFESLEHYNQIFNKLSRKASNTNSECFFIRGNHDSPEYYNNCLINKKRFKTVQDYTVIQTPNHNILCVGGAVSIDRLERIHINNKNLANYLKYHNISESEAILKHRKCYWPDEMPFFDKEALDEINESGIRIDIVATHTSPSFAQPLTKDAIKKWLIDDHSLETDINGERKTMDEIYDKLIGDGHPIQKWIYGHYHAHNSEYINNINFIMLDMCRNGRMDVVQVN